MEFAIRTPVYRHEGTPAWSALISALEELERRGSIRLVDGERSVAAVLCAALERAGALVP